MSAEKKMFSHFFTKLSCVLCTVLIMKQNFFLKWNMVIDGSLNLSYIELA